MRTLKLNMDMKWTQTSQTRKLSMAESMSMYVSMFVSFSLLVHFLILVLEKLSDAISFSKLTQGDGHGHLYNSRYTVLTVIFTL
jgi:hypothetical protein